MGVEMKRAAFAVFIMCSGQSAFGQSAAVTPPSSAMGQDLYVQNCAVCHGTTGMGDGVLASNFTPRPRNFSVGTFRYRSTGWGEPPAQEDLVRVIKNGVEGSYGRSMPAFDSLQPSEIIALADVVKGIAGFDKYGVSVDIPIRPADKNVELGRQLFRENGCYQCHGEAGDGLGVLAAELRDEDNSAIRPANLLVGTFKGGDAAEDIFLRIKYGIDGTPMPSFGQTLSGEEAWALADYVLSLSAEK